MPEYCFLCDSEPSMGGVVCNSCGHNVLGLPSSFLPPPSLDRAKLLMKKQWVLAVMNEDIQEALAHIYHYVPDFYPFIRDAFKIPGLRIRWGETEESESAYFSLKDKEIVLSNWHINDSIGAIAAHLAHEIYHAASPRFSTDRWEQSEIMANIWEVKVWQHMPKAVKGNGGYRLEEKVRLWQEGKVLEMLHQAECYKDLPR